MDSQVLKLLSIRRIFLLVCMLAAALAGELLKPTQKVADQKATVDLQAIIPARFADWVQEDTENLVVPDPRQQDLLNKLYSQTLSRTYRNAGGYKIMLSMAYGGDQTDSTELHKPEVCYPAQGFTLHNKSTVELSFLGRVIPATRIHTSLGARVEPVTYWTTIGDQVVDGNFDKKIVEMQYGLVGKIPDGILVRLSSIDGDLARAYQQQTLFARDLLEAVAPDTRTRLIGAPSTKP